MILALAVLSGVGNSVIHPADYAILAGSIDKGFMGRAFALHTFTGNLGFALAPPAIALMLAFMDWRARAADWSGCSACRWWARSCSEPRPARPAEAAPAGGGRARPGGRCC